MKSDKLPLGRTIRDLLKNTTELIGIGIKNQNIIISLFWKLRHSNNDKLPAVMSWDEFGFKKGNWLLWRRIMRQNELITILDNRRQTTIRNYFLEVSIESPTTGTIYHDGYVFELIFHWLTSSFQTQKSFLIVSTSSSTLDVPFKDKNCHYEPVR